MATRPGHTESKAVPAVDVGELDFSAAELKQLWWFMDGAIMGIETREHLWRTWGLCPRHAWGYAVTEIERRGGEAFTTSILYQDLTDRAAQLVGHRARPWRRIRTHLEPHGTCITCDYLAARRSAAVEAEWRKLANDVNRRPRTRTLVMAVESEWRTRSCPACLGGGGPVCLRHVVAGGDRPDGLAEALSDLAARLKALVGSMTVRHTPVGPAERAAWVEALGWFGGWDYARKLARSDSGADGERSS